MQMMAPYFKKPEKDKKVLGMLQVSQRLSSRSLRSDVTWDGPSEAAIPLRGRAPSLATEVAAPARRSGR